MSHQRPCKIHRRTSLVNPTAADTQGTFRLSEELTAAAEDPHHADHVGATKDYETIINGPPAFEVNFATITAVVNANKEARGARNDDELKVPGDWVEQELRVGENDDLVATFHCRKTSFPLSAMSLHQLRVIYVREGMGDPREKTVVQLRDCVRPKLVKILADRVLAGESVLPQGVLAWEPPPAPAPAVVPTAAADEDEGSDAAEARSWGNIAVESQSPEDVNVGAQLSVREFAAIVEKIQEAQQGKLKHDYADGGFPIEVTKKKKRSRGTTASDPEAVDASSEPAKPPAAKRKSEGGHVDRLEQAVVKSLEGYSRAMEVDSDCDEVGVPGEAMEE